MRQTMDFYSFGPGYMHSTGMSDWNWAEIEDFNWDVDVKSGDHVVPHQSSELLDESTVLSHAHKKPRHEVKYDDGRNFCIGDSANKSVLCGKEDAWYPPMKSGCLSLVDGSCPHSSHIAVPMFPDHESITNGAAFPSQDVRTFDYCVNKSSTDAKTSIFYSKDPHEETKVSTEDNKFCISSHNCVPPDVTDLSYVESVQKGRDDDLAYYVWSNFNNFEDIDEIFRNCDSAFEQEQTSTADDLSWFLSSEAICGFGNAFESDFQPHGGDLGALHVNSDSHGSNVNFLHKNVSSTAGHDKPTSCNYAAWLDTDGPSKVVFADKEKVTKKPSICITFFSHYLYCTLTLINSLFPLCDGGDKLNNTGFTQISNEHSLNQSGASTVKIFSQQKNFMGSPSSHAYGLDPHSQLAFGLPTHRVPFVQITSSVKSVGGINPSSSDKVADHIVNHPTQCLDMFPGHTYMPQDIASEDKTEKLYQKQQLCGAMTASHPHQQLAIQDSVKKKLLEARDGFEMENAGLKCSTVDTVGQEKFGMTSLSSDDISKMLASFQLLEDATRQLDFSTKLHIRDSLYRLSRSARQRQGYTTQNYSKVVPDAKGIQGTKASKSLAEFMDNVETNTNPLDRSIAHLLFHRPPKPAMRSADIRLFESHIANGEVLVPPTI